MFLPRMPLECCGKDTMQLRRKLGGSSSSTTTTTRMRKRHNEAEPAPPQRKKKGGATTRVKVWVGDRRTWGGGGREGGANQCDTGSDGEGSVFWGAWFGQSKVLKIFPDLSVKKGITKFTKEWGGEWIYLFVKKIKNFWFRVISNYKVYCVACPL